MNEIACNTKKKSVFLQKKLEIVTIFFILANIYVLHTLSYKLINYPSWFNWSTRQGCELFEPNQTGCKYMMHLQSNQVLWIMGPIGKTFSLWCIPVCVCVCVLSHLMQRLWYCRSSGQLCHCAAGRSSVEGLQLRGRKKNTASWAPANKPRRVTGKHIREGVTGRLAALLKLSLMSFSTTLQMRRCDVVPASKLLWGKYK